MFGIGKASGAPSEGPKQYEVGDIAKYTLSTGVVTEVEVMEDRGKSNYLVQIVVLLKDGKKTLHGKPFVATQQQLDDAKAKMEQIQAENDRINGNGPEVQIALAAIKGSTRGGLKGNTDRALPAIEVPPTEYKPGQKIHHCYTGIDGKNMIEDARVLARNPDGSYTIGFMMNGQYNAHRRPITVTVKDLDMWQSIGELFEDRANSHLPPTPTRPNNMVTPNTPNVILDAETLSRRFELVFKKISELATIDDQIIACQKFTEEINSGKGRLRATFGVAPIEEEARRKTRFVLANLLFRYGITARADEASGNKELDSAISRFVIAVGQSFGLLGKKKE